MKIIKLQAENVKKLTAVEITPDGNLVVIGGKNKAGKSSVLDAIMYALGGSRNVCDKPVHNGENKAKIVVDIGDMVVKRTFTSEGGSTLTIENKEGLNYKSPQSLLDGLTGKLSFDPLSFANMEHEERIKTLKSLVGVDTSELDKKRKEAYEMRTFTTKILKESEAQLKLIQYFKDAPKEEKDGKELIAKIKEAEKEMYNYNMAINDIGTCEFQIKNTCDEIKNLEAKLEQLKYSLEKSKAGKAELEEKLKQPRKYDLEALRTEYAGINEVNKKVNSNLRHAELNKKVSEQESKVKTLSKTIEDIDAKKLTMVKDAKFPLAELTFSDECVLWNGLPFEQASASEQLSASVAMGIALNPKLKVMLVRDASLLDDDSLKVMAEMAVKHDVQIWLERVGEGKEVSVIIEDGHVKESEVK